MNFAKSIRSTLMMTGLLLLFGCASVTGKPVTTLNTGYSLLIQQSFESLPNGSHLQFQSGKLIQPGNLDRWQTYCRLYVYNTAADARYLSDVLPGQVDIRVVEIDYRSSDYPGRGFFADLSWGVRDVPAFYVYRVSMLIESIDQPDLRNLKCYRKWATPRANKYPTVAEIRAALGDYIKLLDPNGQT